MDTSLIHKKYAARLGMAIPKSADLKLLMDLHRRHQEVIPFENIDIRNQQPLSLEWHDLVAKILDQSRGGFCYELNYLFCLLLRQSHFRVRMISARVFSKSGDLGPEFDHLALMVAHGGKKYLVDVGFGSFSSIPLVIEEGMIQEDQGEYYRISRFDRRYMVVEHSRNRRHWKSLYLFTLVPRTIEEFAPMFRYHQHSPESIFTQGTLATLRTANGRVTLTHDKLVVTNGDERSVKRIEPSEFQAYYQEHFNTFGMHSESVL
ncbi:arylamine N-acetyltransferase family protein [Sanyastnella coralliicola]|uniref:arylamine N-acetyltransferase family protein n=1 Tax=Sanyastnella coralliicola TaxID=3069118 RepID=UPI0027B9284D|nr:arylamine N-acetyltransferase [Longitalea sp. SCSIO 12813]